MLPGLISRVFGAAVELMGGRAPTARYVILLRSDFPPGTAQGSPREGSIQLHLPRDVPLEHVHEYGDRWSEAWAKKTGSPEPVASWVGSTAPLPFHEYWERSDRWIPDLARDSQSP